MNVVSLMNVEKYKDNGHMVYDDLLVIDDEPMPIHVIFSSQEGWVWIEVRLILKHEGRTTADIELCPLIEMKGNVKTGRKQFLEDHFERIRPILNQKIRLIKTIIDCIPGNI